MTNRQLPILRLSPVGGMLTPRPPRRGGQPVARRWRTSVAASQTHREM
jgi:hypothetical protein